MSEPSSPRQGREPSPPSSPRQGPQSRPSSSGSGDNDAAQSVPPFAPEPPRQGQRSRPEGNHSSASTPTKSPKKRGAAKTANTLPDKVTFRNHGRKMTVKILILKYPRWSERDRTRVFVRMHKDKLRKKHQALFNKSQDDMVDLLARGIHAGFVAGSDTTWDKYTHRMLRTDLLVRVKWVGLQGEIEATAKELGLL